MFVLARHGEAGKRKHWDGPDRLRPLSPIGQQQAMGLERNLVMLPAPRLIAGPYLRCSQTLEPLSRRAGRPIETDARLAPDAHAARLDDLLTAHAYDDAVLCTHGETIEMILTRWSEQNMVSLPLNRSEIRKDSTAKGAAWVVIDEGEGWTAHYLGPLHVGPAISDDASAAPAP